MSAPLASPDKILPKPHVPNDRLGNWGNKAAAPGRVTDLQQTGDRPGPQGGREKNMSQNTAKSLNRSGRLYVIVRLKQLL